MSRPEESPIVMVLGVAQDGGHPQIGCADACCAPAWRDHTRRHLPAAMGIVTETGARWMVEASPALPEQLWRLHQQAPRPDGAPLLDGMLITHAHMGHLIGLAHLGNEAAAVEGLPVYLPAGLVAVLRDAIPWSDLIDQGRLILHPLRDGQRLQLSEQVSVTAVEVPHRREWAETLAFVIAGPRRRVLFLPDIDAWSGWPTSLRALLEGVDAAWIDGTFFADGELARDMSRVPHPRVTDTMALLADAPDALRRKVRFSHLNHTNPLLDPASPQAQQVRDAGFQIAWEGEVVGV